MRVGSLGANYNSRGDYPTDEMTPSGSEPFTELHIWTGTGQDGTMRRRRVQEYPEKDGELG